MAFRHEHTESRQIAYRQRLRRSEGPGVLPHDVAGTGIGDRVEPACRRQFSEVAQRRHAKVLRRRLALLAAQVVFAIDQPAFDPRMDDHDCQVSG